MLLLASDILESAGVIVFKDENVLLLKNNKNEWSFPKGKIEENESPVQAARREAIEEAGVVCRIGKKVSIETRFSEPIGKTKVIYWFVGYFDKQTCQALEDHESFTPAWVESKKAPELLSFEADKATFFEALKIVENKVKE